MARREESDARLKAWHESAEYKAHLAKLDRLWRRRQQFKKLPGRWQRGLFVSRDEMRKIETFYGSYLGMPELHREQGHDGSDTTRRVTKRIVFSHWEGHLAFLGFTVSNDDKVLKARNRMEFALRLNSAPRHGFPWFRYITLNLDAAGIKYERQNTDPDAICVQDPIGNDVWIFEGNDFAFLEVSELIDSEGDDE